MLGWGLEVPFAEKPGSIYSYVGRKSTLATTVLLLPGLAMQQVLLQWKCLLCEGHSGQQISQVC